MSVGASNPIGGCMFNGGRRVFTELPMSTIWVLRRSALARGLVAVAAIYLFAGAGTTLQAADITVRDIATAIHANVGKGPVDFTGRDLSELDLAGLDLSAARLERVNFRAADLSDANLKGAHLTGASFNRATLLRTNLAGANLAHHARCFYDIRHQPGGRPDVCECEPERC
jgi:Pentapeptide repeats (8 copies)